jgi:hypothetical protein
MIQATEPAPKTPAEALNEFAWEKRQIIVFTPSLNDSRLDNFIRIKKEFTEDFTERFLQVWVAETGKQVILEGKSRNDVTADAFYKRFNVQPNEFRVVLLGYDQDEKLRQTEFNIDLLIGTIDQMPMRQQEMQSQ